MRRIVLDLEFHGKGFHGWQRQGPDRSVQTVVESAVAELVGHEVSAQSSGRTDRGVHALAMPAHVDLDTRLGVLELMPALNHRLPRDVAIRRVRETDPRFHCRFDARSKLYRYSILRHRARSPLLGDRAHQVTRPLNLEAMADAAARLQGRHDFKSFQTNPQRPEPAGDLPETTADTVGPAAVASGATEPPPWRRPRPQGTVRTITSVRLTEDGDLLLIDVEGDGFLRGMVRSVAGTLVQVGLGRQSPSWVSELIDARDRREAGANLPPHGLCLIRVDYPAEPFDGRESTDALKLA